MPELPEVEVVRRGLDRHAVGRTVQAVEVRHPRAVRRHLAGGADLADRLAGRRLMSARRRGKYLWLPLDSGDALVAHLGMSGQLLVQPPGTEDETHLRVRLVFTDGGPELRFIDQRTFGGLALESDAGDLPRSLAHIARDPLDPEFDLEAVVTALRRRRTGLKRALLDQALVSGVGNIYADEALWDTRLHWARPTEELRRPEARAVITAASDVMRAALGEGGTSFDRLYVDVNGQSGWFDRSLHAYGQAGRPCARCGALIVREAFMNRSSFRCPRCQRTPRRPRW